MTGEGRIKKLLAALQRESPVNLAREAVWRTNKRWRRARLPEQLSRAGCPVTYRPIGYYNLQTEKLTERSRAAILRYADAICDGQFPWFAYGPVQLGFPPRWNFDFVSGVSWPDSVSDAIAVVPGGGSDVKVPWELSRLQFLPVLGKAWVITRDERYRNAGKHLLTDWIEKNPVGYGVNWTIAMEAALRAMSICFFLELAYPSPGEQCSFLPTAEACLWKHLLFIEAYNEFSHIARGNHYLSNIVGLLCLSSFLDGKGMQQRRRLYVGLVEQEMLQQVYADGGSYEASTGYHVLVLQMFTSAFLLMRSPGIAPCEDFVQRLRLMYRYLAALSDQPGTVSHVGDCDDGRVELLGDDLEQMMNSSAEQRHSLAVSSLLGVGQQLFAEDYAGREDESLWYSSGAAPQEPATVPSLRQSSVVFPRSGVAVARIGELRVDFFAMPNAIQGKGGHTHNDKLSVVVSLAGEKLFVDSGTGCYTRDPELRNQLRSTAAHNTIEVDSEEQNRFSKSPALGFLFGISNDAKISEITAEESEGKVMLRASHDGYRRLGITHTRTIRLAENSLQVEDQLAGSGSHDFESRFHLPQSWRVKLENSEGREVNCLIDGPRPARLFFRAPVELQLRSVLAKISQAYGSVLEATVVSVWGKFQPPLQISSELCWNS